MTTSVTQNNSITIGDTVAKVHMAPYTAIHNWTVAYGPFDGDLGKVNSFIKLQTGPEKGTLYALVEYKKIYKDREVEFTIAINPIHLRKIVL